MISVIMPVWNGTRFMDRAIASVVAQTQAEWELLIVDDGSTDDSLTRAHRWRDLVNDHFNQEKIQVLSTGTNSGPSVARNLAAAKARYDLFAYLDHDDLYSPRRLESLLPFFDRYDLVFAPYEILQNGRLGLWNVRAEWERQSYLSSSEGEREPSFAAWARARLQRGNSFAVPLGVAHRREIFERVGGFQPGVVVGEDGILWRRMAEGGARIGFSPVVAGRYHVRQDSQARTQRLFSTGGFKIQRDHPLGSNGQYLDGAWYAALSKPLD